MGRIILGAGEVLEDHLQGVVELAVGEARAAENVGVDRQGRGELAGHHGAGEARMAGRHRLCPLDPGALEDLDDLAAGAVAGSAEHHLA